MSRRGRGKNVGDSEMVKLSKSLSWALRHGISELGLTMTSAGFVRVDELLAHQRFSKYSEDHIRQVVETNDKKRFDIAEIDGNRWIRANQGHTISIVKDEDLLTEIIDPSLFPIAVHGTDKKSWLSIMKRGLYKMRRNHIHFAIGYPESGQVISGARSNCTVFIEIDLEKAMQDGLKFFISSNSVILTSGIKGFLSPKYFKKVYVDRVEVPFEWKPIELDYFLVLDFEANCIENAELKCQEIIEFPVQALNTKTLQIDHTFHYYVKPDVVPELTAFCTQLTGITQNMVDSGIPLLEVLQKFHEFLEETGIISKNWLFLTCGDWDLKTCLPKEAIYKSYQVAPYFYSWVNIKHIFPSFMAKGMMEILSLLEIDHVGRHHSGIDDVTNIARCMATLLQAGVGVFESDIHKSPLIPKRNEEIKQQP